MAEPSSLHTKMKPQMADGSRLHIAMTIFQLGYAGNHVILRAALNMGISKFVFPVYRNIIALLMMAPFAYFIEKKDRPPLTISFLIMFFILGFVGYVKLLMKKSELNCIKSGILLVRIGQHIANICLSFRECCTCSDLYLGNLAQARLELWLILCSSWVLRLEQVHFNRKDGVAKVFGTLTSFIGASVITLYKGPSIYRPNSTSNQSKLWFSFRGADPKNWTLGCVSSFGHCLCWSSWIVLQATFLNKYPAPFSVYSFTCFFGILQLLAVAAYVERDLQTWQVHSSGELFSLLYAGIVVSGIGFAIQIWVIQRGGPVFVSGYLPLQTMLVAVMASIALGEEFYLGSIIGAALIIAGLYLVIWGKSAENKLAMTEVVTSVNNLASSSSKSSLGQPLLPEFNG